MSRPRLFLHVVDAAIEKALLNSEKVKQCLLVKSHQDERWDEQLTYADCNIAIIEEHDFNRQHVDTLQALSPDLEFIFLSKGLPNSDLDNFVLQTAAYHYRTPYDLVPIDETLQDILEDIQQPTINAQKVRTSDLDQFGLLVGSSKTMRKLYRTIRKVASSESSVLIIGESGSGKELIANTLHLSSPRSEQPFIAINCGALSPELVDSELFGHVKGAFTGANRDHKGVFEQAEGGTLFLDEVTEMPLDHQVKLLRVLETGEYRPVGSSKTRIANVRIVAATNRDPAQAIADEIVREDLYFRLSQFPINVPPLRERGEDIIGLAKHFLAYRNANEGLAKHISEDALAQIANHSWPGNVRELKHVIERAFILADDVITSEHLVLDDCLEVAESEAMAIPAGVPLEEIEKTAITATLASNQGNKTETAEQLGISVKTLYNKLEKFKESGEN